jgi:predicted ABC-type exoprotein transport system permease subunit
MSIVAVWQVNSLGFLVVLGWWGSTLVRAMPALGQLGPFNAVALRTLTSALLLLLGATLVLTTSDRRNPTQYAFQAWQAYPSLLRAPFRSLEGCVTMACVANRPDPLDVALITTRIPPSEPVAIIGVLYDWTYLISAHRPPMLSFLPSAAIFTQHQLEQSVEEMARANYWFVAKGPNGTLQILPQELRDTATPILDRDFVFDGEGPRLTAWRRREAAH